MEIAAVRSGRRRASVRRVRAVAVAVVAACLVVLPSGAVSAHAIVDAIVPADGSVLDVAPSRVVVTFSESMLATGLAVDVASSVDPAPIASVALDPTDARAAIVTLPPLTDGTFIVRVSARDAEDLHETIARSSFAVGDAVLEASPPVVAPPEPGEMLARWTFIVGLALLIGVDVMRSRWMLVPISRPGRLRRIVVAACTMAVFGRVGVLVARALALDAPLAASMRAVVATPDARRLLPFALGTLCIVIAETSRPLRLDVPVRSGGRLTCRRVLWWAGVGELALLASWGDHSALSGSVAPLMALAKSAHLIGIGLWVGVLAVVVIVTHGTGSTKATLSAMSRIATTGAVVTVVSGVLLASRLVVSVTALLSTPYGLLLTAKIALIVVAGAIGWAVHRGLPSRWSGFELAALVFVVAFGAGMATATPAIDPAFLSTTEADAPVVSPVDAEDLVVELRAIPGRPGTNSLELRIADTRRPSPGIVTTVDLDVAGTRLTVPIDADGLGLVDGVDLPAGASNVELTMHRPGWHDTSARIGLVAEPPVYVHSVRVSSAPLRTPLAMLGALIAVAALVVRRRARTDGASSAGPDVRSVPDAPRSKGEPRTERTGAGR